MKTRCYKIALGRSRKETHWRTVALRWADLVARLQEPKRTEETVAEYAASSKDRRAGWKDCGGFVGGPVTGGRRKRGSVATRSLLTLDMDNATAEAWDDLTMQYDCAAALYSTHSHTPERPRYRIVMPLSRDVTAEEYEAVARGVARTLGEECFDPSTYEPERLMYWPSCPKDGTYEFHAQEGAPLDADDVLAHYRDWRDTAQWALSDREREAVRRATKRQGDPTGKPGAVGRFCRAYDVPEAIAAFLGDVYAPTEHPDRYTYKAGTTAGGLVVYEGGKFAYSHHGTDPARGKLLNAFDLVRLHLYGDEDRDAPEGTPTNRLPSYRAMEALTAGDAEVRKLTDAEMMDRVREDFAGVAETEDDSWMEDLVRTEKGAPKNCIANAVLVAKRAPGLRGHLHRDLLARRDYATGRLPWRDAGDGSTWTDADDANWRAYLAKYGVTTKQYAQDALEIAFDARARHPVREFLRRLPPWDGKERVDTLLTDRLGAEDCELTRAVIRKALTAAVARVMDGRPGGVKFDYCTVLSGPEGIGKSTFVRDLFAPWFTDSVTTLAGKEAMEQIQGAWGVELGELSAIRRADLEGVKAFLSKQEDRYRPAYGRNVVIQPRQCVFFATTNELEFLKGDTGNRRFWVVDCPGRADRAPWTEEARQQVWAEALARWKEGEPLYLTKDLERAMRERQAGHNEGASDPRPGMIAAYLDLRLPTDWARRDVAQRACYVADEEERERLGAYQRDRVCAVEILCELFRRPVGGTSRYDVREINAIMDRMPGWVKADIPMKFPLYGLQRGYKRAKSGLSQKESEKE